MHSFLLIGQSNMAGRGYLNEAHEIDASRIYTLRNGRWTEMFRPINPDRDFSGVNLGESFAEAYAKKYNVDVGLICCADGGTSLEQWKPGDVLFDNAVHQAKLASRSSQIVGILWHQGEADCNPSLYPTYKERLEAMMAELRQQLDLSMSVNPELLVAQELYNILKIPSAFKVCTPWADMIAHGPSSVSMSHVPRHVSFPLAYCKAF